jgi:hypothetical protein
MVLIYERENDFVLAEQNNHAILSGDLFSHWREDLFVGNRRSDMLFAIRNHDRAWMGLDATPLWNDGQNSPYSFIDLPPLLKLPHYQYGIDWVERKNKYAALLCSQHYASFFNHAKEDAEQAYYQYELERQNRLRVEIGDISESENNNHLGILKFFDKLSIYICINEPGVLKDDEFGWYRDGFEGTEQLFNANGGRIVAHWLNEKSVGLSVFPFTQKFEISVPTKIVSKHAIQRYGVAKAYRTTPSTIRTVEIGPMPM